MKNLTLVTNNLDIGGSQIVLINLVNEALLNNYIVNVISLTNNLFLIDRINKNGTINFYTCSNKKNSSGFFNRIKISYNFFKIIYNIKPKLLHSHFWQIDIIYLLLLTYFSNIKIIHTIHSPGSSYLRIKLIDYLNNFIEKIFINQKNVIVTVVSEEIERVIRAVLNFKKKCLIISNGINIIDNTKINSDIIPFQKQNGYKYFIYPARFQESKGHKFLLEAFKQLTAEVLNVKLILIGTNLENNLKNIVSNLNIENSVIFLNPIDDINKILIHCDFGVFPSFYEGHSIALCEMMAIGLPVVVSDIVGNRVVADNGNAALLYRVDSEDELYFSMKELLKNPRLSSQLSINAQKHIQDKYGLKKFFSEYNKIYETI